MDHVAIMNKSWRLTPKILTGEKTVESRWHRTKRAPWGRISPGDKVYFKDSGEPVRLVAEVSQVLQISDLTALKVKRILTEYGAALGVEDGRRPEFLVRFRQCRYCVLIFLQNPRSIEPFEIDKKGFGSQAAWLTVKDIGSIKAAV